MSKAIVCRFVSIVVYHNTLFVAPTQHCVRLFECTSNKILIAVDLVSNIDVEIVIHMLEMTVLCTEPFVGSITSWSSWRVHVCSCILIQSMLNAWAVARPLQLSSPSIINSEITYVSVVISIIIA